MRDGKNDSPKELGYFVHRRRGKTYLVSYEEEIKQRVIVGIILAVVILIALMGI